MENDSSRLNVLKSPGNLNDSNCDLMSFSSPAASGFLQPQKIRYDLSPLVAMPSASRLNSVDSPRSGEEPVAASTPFFSVQNSRSDDPFDVPNPFDLVETFFSQQKTAYDPFEMLEQAASASNDPFESVSQQARSSDTLNKGFVEGSSGENSGEKVEEQTAPLKEKSAEEGLDSELPPWELQDLPDDSDDDLPTLNDTSDFMATSPPSYLALSASPELMSRSVGKSCLSSHLNPNSGGNSKDLMSPPLLKMEDSKDLMSPFTVKVSPKLPSKSEGKFRLSDNFMAMSPSQELNPNDQKSCLSINLMAISPPSLATEPNLEGQGHPKVAPQFDLSCDLMLVTPPSLLCSPIISSELMLSSPPAQLRMPDLTLPPPPSADNQSSDGTNKAQQVPVEKEETSLGKVSATKTKPVEPTCPAPKPLSTVNTPVPLSRLPRKLASRLMQPRVHTNKENLRP